MRPKIAVIGTLRFPPKNIKAVLMHLEKLVELTYENDNCILYSVAEDPFDAGLIRISELWPDQATLDHHLRADHIKPWRDAAHRFGLMERYFTAFRIEDAWEL